MRKTVEVTISAKGRDEGKKFLITEMPAFKAEQWATRSLFLLAKAGIDVPEEAMAGGMASIAALGIKALLYVSYEDAKPILDDLMGCVEIVETAATRKLSADDIEEVQTFFTLRGEALKLHLDFFQDGGPLRSTSPNPQNSSATPTSRPPSAQSSRPAKHR